jgi:hypothetical protein
MAICAGSTQAPFGELMTLGEPRDVTGRVRLRMIRVLAVIGKETHEDIIMIYSPIFEMEIVFADGA